MWEDGMEDVGGGDGQKGDFEKEIPASAFLCVSMGAAGEEGARMEGDNKWE